MKKKLVIFCVLFQLVIISLFSQPRITISGQIKAASTGEDLIGAIVSIKEFPSLSVATNAYGFFSLSLPLGTYELTAQYTGFKSQIIPVKLDRSLKLNFSLLEQSRELNEVVVYSKRRDENVSSTKMGMVNLDPNEIKNIPVLFGEKDLLKTIQLLPGIIPVGEGRSGFNVRGGGPDQNLILLDEATVYNASHLMGFFSVFNSDAIKDISVFKGNEPAEYGGRLSSVLDLKMNDGNDKKFGVSGGMGLISSRLLVEGPIVKDKGSFIISARRTYADLFLKASPDTSINKAVLYFYDLNAKANYRINAKNRIYLSGYFGQDVLGFGNTFGINWGNSTATLRWNHLYSDRLFSNSSLIFSDYNYQININSGVKMNIISRIRDYSLKQDFQYFGDNKNTFKFGFNEIYHQIIPGAITAITNVSLKSLTNKYALEHAGYFSHLLHLNDNLSTEYGTRVSLFNLIGPGTFYTYDAAGNTASSNEFSSGKFVKSYLNLEPRLSINYTLDPVSSIKTSYARNVQNLHLLSNSTSGNPTDLWIPSSNNVRPELADQISTGYYRNFKANLYEFSAEIYYKKLQNQIDYKNGAELNFNENVESQILFGDGRAYGLELYLKKKQGRFNGWVSYTLSRTERKVDGVNRGSYYPAKQDRTHDISIVGLYDLSKRWSLSATWVYYTGNAVTFPSGKYVLDGKTMFYYKDRNANRMPAYHRLDLGATWIRKRTATFESSWTFSLYNAYGHDNPYTITFQDSKTDPTKTDVIQTTLFKLVPSFTYNFKF